MNYQSNAALKKKQDNANEMIFLFMYTFQAQTDKQNIIGICKISKLMYGKFTERLKI